MTPREELIQAIQTSPDNVVSELLIALKRLKPQSQKDIPDLNLAPPEQVSDRLREKNGFLVVETEGSKDFDINGFIKEMREERIQKFVDQAGL